MKLSQQVYDSFDNNNFYKKTQETHFHRQKLEEIKNRKKQFVENVNCKIVNDPDSELTKKRVALEAGIN